ncbi:efflux RND transporter periplasmic adaptor subunit [Thiohalorhabdus denitrificans]|uniref:RND family efflux transporter, MFP subunit n=1 Tax=Thiohalorhabdus denitrificans TaxID=381306 RepID=A0A1G5AUP3_9GAMM|nr:efflux RND transporter periplasmic adaptor subunit [Thiohalorhabdus denitrificans]SCX81617.1 RND family efflux transporter, MFP subunit [Thiohalorhabdus denitrificans]
MKRAVLASLVLLALGPVEAVGQAAQGPWEGRLEARRALSMGAQVSGPVAEVVVEEGDRVKEGELLARIDPSSYQAALAKAEARLERAEAVAKESSRELERQQKIYDRGLSAQHDLEIAQRDADRDRAAVEEARAAVRQARVDLGYTEIRAPIDGVVVKRNVHPGETVIANLRPPLLFRLATSAESLDVVVNVGEEQVAGLGEGDELEVTFPAFDRNPLRGEVVRIGQAPVDAQQEEPRYPVRVRVPNPEGDLRMGMRARVAAP